jgi:hypothetical protein
MARGAPSVPLKATCGHPLLGLSNYVKDPYKKGPKSFTGRLTTAQRCASFTILCPSWAKFKWGRGTRS